MTPEANLPDRPLKVLFVCSRNYMRSLTAEKIFRGLPGLQVRSVGTQPEARIVINEGHVGWADTILVMDKSHRRKLEERFGDQLDGKELIVLHIPDDYTLLQPELIDELIGKAGPHLPLPPDFGGRSEWEG